MNRTIHSVVIACAVIFSVSTALLSLHRAVGESSAASTFSCNGSVVDADGNPVKQAKITCYQMIGASDAADKEPPVERTATTDSKGEFEFRVSATTYKVIIIETPNLAPTWACLDEPTEKHLSFILSKASEFAGIVTDTNKVPVSNAEVWCAFVIDEGALRSRSLAFQQAMLFGSLARKWYSTRSDANGRFRITRFPQRGSALLAARARGFASRSTSSSSESWFAGGVGARAGEDKIEIPMVATGVYQSRLAIGATHPAYDLRTQTIIAPGQSGQPVANAKIFLQPRGETWAGRRMETTTASDGTFRFEDVAPGEYRIGGEQPDLNLKVQEITTYVQPGQIVTNRFLNAVLGGGAVIRVRTTDDLPVAGAKIEIGDEHVQTGADGSHLFYLPEGDHHVRVQKTRFNDGGRDFVVWARKTNAVTIRLKPSPKIGGFVLGPDGKPVAKAHIIAFLLDVTSNFDTESGADGKFELGWHDNYDRQISKSSGVIARLPSAGLVGFAPFEAGKRDIAIKLEPGLSIRGKVTDENGIPIAHVMVTATPTDHSPMRLQFDATTAADGRFAIDALPVGRSFYVRPVINGYRKAPTRVEPGKTTKVDLDPFVVNRTANPQPTRPLNF